MKKLTRRGFTAAGILAALGSGFSMLTGCDEGGCSFNPLNNQPEAVYGPPEWFDPSNNEVEDVYGPPEYFDEPDDDDEPNDEPDDNAPDKDEDNPNND